MGYNLGGDKSIDLKKLNLLEIGAWILLIKCCFITLPHLHNVIH